MMPDWSIEDASAENGHKLFTTDKPIHAITLRTTGIHAASTNGQRKAFVKANIRIVTKRETTNSHLSEAKSRTKDGEVRDREG